jgi:septum formation protein
MTGAARLILASASPRRLELLAQIAIVPALVKSAVIDETPRKSELPAELVRRLSEAKVMAIAGDFPDDYVLGADTVVALGRRILGKPDGEETARRHLGLLSGRRHLVYGGICVAAPGGRKSVRVIKTAVRFKRLTTVELETYIATGEWQNKAGSYGIQGFAAAFVPAINGSYSNVVGLSLSDARAMLAGLGYSC